MKAQDFFCGRSVEERIAAVKGLYEQAAGRFRTAGADFHAPWLSSPTGSIYARADGAAVSLTVVGRGAGPS